jgi:hypothetical protein
MPIINANGAASPTVRSSSRAGTSPWAASTVGNSASGSSAATR